jgi:hypothetical protein
MKLNGHNFQVDGGMCTDQHGKPHWPDSLNMWIPKEKVLPLIEQLARALQVYSSQEEIPLNFMGKLEYKNETVDV